MMNFNLRAFMDALVHLNVAQTRARVADPEKFPTLEALGQIKVDLAPIEQEAIRLDMPTVIARLSKIARTSGRGPAAPMVHSHMR